MRVFIAEKPSLATAIFKGLDGNPDTQKKAGYYQKGNDIVTWCFGHLLALKNPEDYDIELKQWTLDSLPLDIRYPPQYKPIPNSKKQLNIVVGFIKQASTIVHAGDPDPEGCLLIDEILDYADNKKPVQRLLIADLNEKPVKHALANMQPNERFRNLTNRALARSVGDQAHGYNLTRAYTLKAREKGHDTVFNVGRVISALLGMVNVRTLANKNHQMSYYYLLNGTFQINGHAIKGKLQPNEDLDLDEKNRLICGIQAQAIKEADSGEPGEVIAIDTKKDKRQPPMPFNLSRLQIEASKKWGYKPKETLDIIQALYEKHKLLTYPRSDSQYLSDAILENSPGILDAIKNTHPDLSGLVNDAASTSTHNAFNTEKIEAHHAIIPTEKNGAGIELSSKERAVYELVAKRFIGLFYPESCREKTTIDIRCTGRVYQGTQITLESQGWEVLAKGEYQDKPNDNPCDLSTFKTGATGTCEQIDVEQKETKPPKYFDDASLLKAMTEAAKFVKDPVLRKQLEAKDKNTKGENGSIGTEATRSNHIEKLRSLKHWISFEKEPGYKNPVFKTTATGQEFCALLPDEIIMPDISAIWEGDLERIANGDYTIQQFLQSVERYIQEQVAHVKEKGVALTTKVGVQCPTCQKGELRRLKGKKGHFWACNRYPDCKSVFPDNKGKPNLNPAPKQKVKPSETELCKCGKGLVRRSGKKEGSFWWGCSGFPKCKVRYFDKNGHPDRDAGELS